MSSKRTKGILIYNLLMKEVSKINKNLPEDRKLSIKERRKLISEKIYPKYRGESKSRIRLTPLREKLVNVVRRIPRKQSCDVLAIPQTTYQDVSYFEIEQFIEAILPDCIYVKVDAGEYGITNVFNTRDFNYYSSGISEITNRINTVARNENMDTGSVPSYRGRINLRPGKKNDGNSENYFLEMILSHTGRRPKLDLQIPYKKKTKTQIKKEGNVKQYIRDRIKAMKNEKSVFKRIKKDILKGVKDMQTVMRQRFISNEAKKEFKAKKFDSLVKKIDTLFDTGKISEAKHRKFTTWIKRDFGKRKG